MHLNYELEIELDGEVVSDVWMHDGHNIVRDIENQYRERFEMLYLAESFEERTFVMSYYAKIPIKEMIIMIKRVMLKYARCKVINCSHLVTYH